MSEYSTDLLQSSITEVTAFYTERVYNIPDLLGQDGQHHFYFMKGITSFTYMENEEPFLDDVL